MPKFDEKSLVENYFADELQEISWNFVPADNLERESLEEPLLTANLIRAIKKLNAGLSISDEEIKQALNELKLMSSGVEGSKQILDYFKHGIPVKFEKERVVHFVKLFDYDDAENNEFIVSRQVIHQAGNKQIRNDLILYVNGIPLVNIECKNPASLTENWYNAFLQIEDYASTTPELYKYVQIGVAAEQTARYFATVPWQQEDTKIHQWREPDKDAIDSTIAMLTPATLLNIVKNYLFFRVEHGTATKVVTRYMQYRAAEQIYNRATNHVQGKDPRNKGLIWHWQGSGKTLTMIFAANKLYQDPPLENPTIFFIVDREELETQLGDEFKALDITKPETVDSINALRAILKHDENRGKRGIFITLIHKFRPEELTELQKELDALSKTQETIQTRRNVVLFIDEAHRTQYGLLAAQMKQILKNASSFALTGTPIAKIGRDTYSEFSYPPEEKYLDKYFITDSIEDGFTLKIAYQPRLEKDVHLNKQMLDAFMQIGIYDEIPEEYREKTEEKIKQKLNTIKVFLENKDRIRLVAQDITQHFKENLDGKFKALVVAVNRLACVRYKRELDRLLPKEYSEVVMTFNPRKDRQEIQDYTKELANRHHGKDIEDIRKDIIDKYKEENLPKILIVTDMLLTGFDVPILQTMYLDKPLKEHRLLQAVARTNRPYKDIKEAGLIIDYVGTLKEFTKAFENYTKEDITGVLIDTKELVREFTQNITETITIFADIPKDQYDRQTMLKALETVTTNEQNTKKFRESYRHLRKLFELLGPHPIKLEKLKEYTWLTQVYAFYIHETRQEQYESQRYVQKYFQKTLKYVYKTTELADIEKQYPTIQFDAEYLKNLQEKLKTKQEKAANILFTLNRFIIIDKHRNPIYETLTERVERILKLWKEKTKDFEKIYNEGAQIVNEIAKLQSRQKTLGYTDFQYSVLLNLEKKLGPETDLTRDTQELTNQLQQHIFRGWQYQQTAKKTIEREVRKYLRKYIKQKALTLTDLEELYKKIMESVKTYG
jgi:type I restriction enzyme R subunit